VSQPKKLPGNVASEFRAIHQAVLLLFAQWKLYSDLSKPEHRVLMRHTSPDAFSLIMFALRNEITMAHGRLFDPAKSQVGKERRDNLCLARLLELIRPHCQVGVSSILEVKLREAKAHCRPMLAWRNKSVGHSDWKAALAPENDPLPTIGPEAITKGLQKIGDLLNEIDMHFKKRTTPFEHVLMDGTGDDLMRYLKDALDARDSRSVRETRSRPESSLLTQWRPLARLTHEANRQSAVKRG
jgi:hypothetical protein